jgi:hypothetical protein
MSARVRAIVGAGVAVAIGFAAGGSTGSPRVAATCDRGAETAPGNPPLSPDADDLVVGHRVVLVDAAGPKVNEFRDHPGGWWWLKTLVVLRKGRAVTLTVPRGERGRLHLRYKGSSRTATFRPCRHAAHWNYYPGGFVYSQRGCYALDIRIEGHRAVRHYIPLGVGAHCDANGSRRPT